MKRCIALVEDDEVILENYADFLSGLGFQVDRYPSKLSALRGLRERPPDLVLLDISLNGERDAGFVICAQIRRHTPLLPVIFLTSHDAEVDKVSGLRLDADDYITKDVSLDYLIVRIEALFRRLDTYAMTQASNPEPHPASDGAADIRFDAQRSTVTWRSQPVEVTLTQFWILQELCRSPGRVKSTSELMRGAKLTVAPNTIAAHIGAIRAAFLELDHAFDRIRTERGRGYRWIPG